MKQYRKTKHQWSMKQYRKTKHQSKRMRAMLKLRTSSRERTLLFSSIAFSLQKRRKRQKRILFPTKKQSGNTKHSSS
jgi:hypothetical protein